MKRQARSTIGPVTWLDAVDSTNRELMRRLADGRAGPGAAVAARDQTAGRGRYARSWQMTPGRDVALSFAWAAPDPAVAVSLPMAAALAVVDLLNAFDLPARTKWPNDVMVRGRKIAGLLAETAGAHVVVGIGLNVGMGPRDLDRIDRPATSVVMESGWDYGVEAVVDLLLPLLASRVQAWEAGGFDAVRADWEAATLWLGEPVRVREGETELTGTLAGFGPCGELRLRQDDGTPRDVLTGDLLRQA